MTTGFPRKLFGSLDEMLSTEAMGRLEGRPVAAVRTEPFASAYGGVSGNAFLSVTTTGRSGESAMHSDGATGNDGEPRRYIVKRTSPAWDIIMRATNDRSCREMLVWQHGLLDRLPPEVGHTMLACAVDRSERGDDWAILMRDVGELMHAAQRFPEPGWEALTERQLAVFLDGLSALHAAYWEDPALLDSQLGLCKLPWLYRSFSPATARREANSHHVLVGWLRDGWQSFYEVAPPDVVRLVQRLHTDPGPLCDALGGYPWTLVHGDPNCKNVGIELEPAPRLLLLDWQLVTRAPATVDLAFFLSLFSAVLPVPKQDVVGGYRERLTARLGDRFDERTWQPQLELALLGHLLRFGAVLSTRMTRHPDPFVRAHYREELAWWSERALAGARWM